jgi:hypothetical protein
MPSDSPVLYETLEVYERIKKFAEEYNKTTNSRLLFCDHEMGPNHFYDSTITHNTIVLKIVIDEGNYIYGDKKYMYTKVCKLFKKSVPEFDGHLETNDKYIIINHHVPIKIKFYVFNTPNESVEQCKGCKRYINIHNLRRLSEHIRKYHNNVWS